MHLVLTAPRENCIRLCPAALVNSKIGRSGRFHLVCSSPVRCTAVFSECSVTSITGGQSDSIENITGSIHDYYGLLLFVVKWLKNATAAPSMIVNSV